MTQRYLKQLSGTFVLRMLSMLLSLLYVPVVLDFLRDEKYGVWVTLTTIINWIKLFDVGLGNGLRNKLAETIALKDSATGRKFVSTTYYLLGAVFLGVILIFISINHQIDWNSILKVKDIPSSELAAITQVSVVLVLVGFVLQTVVYVFDADGNTVMGGVMQFLSSLISLVLIWSSRYFVEQGNLLYLAWVLTGVPVVVYLGFTLYCFGVKYRQLRPSYKQVQLKSSGSLLSLSGKFFIIQITAAILFSSVPFIVNRFYSPREVAQYSIVSSLFNLPVIVMTLVVFPISPLVTQAYARGDSQWIRQMLKRMRWVSVAVAAGCLLLLLVSPMIFKIWIGDRVSIPWSLSIAVALYTVVYVVNTPSSVFLNSTGKVRTLVILGPLGISVFLGLCFLFKESINQVYSVALALALASLIGTFVLPVALAKSIKEIEHEGNTGR